MKQALRIFGICTSFDDPDDLNFEKRSLYEAAQRVYDEVVLLDSREVVYEFLRGEQKPLVRYRGRDISGLTSLHVRSTKGREASIAILVRALSLCGCDIFDPIDRFFVGYASKLLSTVSRSKTGIGTDTYIAFDKAQALELVAELIRNNQLPLVIKPIAGKRGVGVSLLTNALDVINAVSEHFEVRLDNDFPVFLQKYVNFVAEYRVMMVDGDILGVALKQRAEGKVAANVAQGATLVAVNEPSVNDFVNEYVRESGVLGVDVALDSLGSYHIIESNRAPEWETFQEVTGVDVAGYIVARSADRVMQSSLDEDLVARGTL